MPTSTIALRLLLAAVLDSTVTSGPPIWAWRDSSVWMLEIRLENVQSPTSAASAARPRNCMLVKPVSKRTSASAPSPASRVMNMSSKMWRAAMMPHSLVSNALCAQSNWRSLRHSSCGKNSWICAWRISSIIPSVAMLRMPGALPKRAMRASAVEAEYSPRAIAP
jgi:hypothetical protein